MFRKSYSVRNVSDDSDVIDLNVNACNYKMIQSAGMRFMNLSMTGKKQMADIVYRLRKVRRYNLIRLYLGLFIMMFLLVIYVFWDESTSVTVIRIIGITLRHIFITISLLLVGIWLYLHVYIVRETYRNPLKDQPYRINLGIYGRNELIALFEKQLPLTRFDERCWFASFVKQMANDWRFFIFSPEAESCDEVRKQMNEYIGQINEETGFKLAPYHLNGSAGWSEKGCLMIFNHIPEEIKSGFQQNVLKDIWQPEPTVYFLADLDEGALYIPRLCERTDVSLKYGPYVFAIEKFADHIDSAEYPAVNAVSAGNMRAMKKGSEKYTTIRKIRTDRKLKMIKDWIWILIVPFWFILLFILENSYWNIDLAAVYGFSAAAVIVLIIWLSAFLALRRADYKKMKDQPYCIDTGVRRHKEDIIADLEKITSFTQINEECLYGSVTGSDRIDLRLFVLSIEDMYRKNGYEIADQYVREVNELTDFVPAEHLYKSEGGYGMRVQIMICEQLSDDHIRQIQIRAESELLEKEPCVTFKIDLSKNAVYFPKLNPEKLTPLELTPYFDAIIKIGSYLHLK